MKRLLLLLGVLVSVLRAMATITITVTTDIGSGPPANGYVSILAYPSGTVLATATGSGVKTITWTGANQSTIVQKQLATYNAVNGPPWLSSYNTDGDCIVYPVTLPIMNGYSPTVTHSCSTPPVYATNYFANLNYTNLSTVNRTIAAQASASGTNHALSVTTNLPPGGIFTVRHTNSAPFTVNVFSTDNGFSTDFSPSLGIDRSVNISSTGLAMTTGGPATDASVSAFVQGDPFVVPNPIPAYTAPTLTNNTRASDFSTTTAAAQTQNSNDDARIKDLKDMMVALAADQRNRDNAALQQGATISSQQQLDDKRIVAAVDNLTNYLGGVTSPGTVNSASPTDYPGDLYPTNGAFLSQNLVSGMARSFSVSGPGSYTVTIPLASIDARMDDATIDFGSSDLSPYRTAIRGVALLLVTISFFVGTYRLIARTTGL